MTTQLVKNHSPPMMGTTDTLEGPKDREVQSRSVDGQPGEAEIQKQAKGAFPFLKLPGEIRNMIYAHILASHEAMINERGLLDQPPITRVNRQTRAETLSRYYRTVSVFLIETESSNEWVGYVKKALDAFTSGPLGLSRAQSSLRHVNFMMLDFITKSATPDKDVHIQVDLGSEPLDPILNHDRGDLSEVVAVGIPTMDWTDDDAVRAACDEAATRLEEILTKRLAQAEEHEEHENDEVDEDHEAIQRIATSTPEVLRAAVDAMRLFISACPHLKHVSIYDSSWCQWWAVYVG
ncbi:hypothetical protein KVR01_009398 [Diaporthe batatas]|uniref:uncharacterized protein n=1 Tax=Diaporthe batatas TaxID=748121 RepID=UPI001D04EECA|nr:uncharacterized protein KVR01_009398 [Diaporthe batatas]KAG8161134.1 hypothetical protein KVR01_009398 [Diaporthe batatas]